MSSVNQLNDGMDEETCFAWGKIFALPWKARVEAMSARAGVMGYAQATGAGYIAWSEGEAPRVRFVFIDDPANIESVRAVFNDDENLRWPVCLLVVRQNDPSETRGDEIFDLFRMSSQSYLSHFYRVYTPLKTTQKVSE